MESDSFLFEPPAHPESYLFMMDTVHPQPFIRRNQEFLEIWDREMDLVAIGEKSARRGRHPESRPRRSRCWRHRRQKQEERKG